LTPKEKEVLEESFNLRQDLLDSDIEWGQLKLKLISMQRKDLVDTVESETEITKGKLK